jgi:anaerobilin synthase
MFEGRYRSHHDSKRLTDKIIEENLKNKGKKKRDLKEIMNSEGINNERVLYVHTPYCDKICTFCNLNKELIKGKTTEYAEYLSKEFEKYGKTKYVAGKPFQVIYFGGGTPTVYSLADMEIILRSLRKNINLSDDYEFTFETTIHNLSKEKLKLMESYGVNRLSIGIQTFSDKGRKLLNRTFSGEEAFYKVKEIKENFGGHICGDIIYSYPGQSEEEVLADAEYCNKVSFDSVSFYSLMVSKGSALEKMISNGTIINNRTDENDRKNHNLFLQKMAESKYELIELSKLGIPERDRYNYIKLRYRNADTFPVGVGAGGVVEELGVFRMNKMITVDKHIEPSYFRYNELLGRMQYGEFERNYLEGFLKKEAYNKMIEMLENYKKNGLTEESASGYRLTQDGIFWGNNIAVDLMKIIIPIEMKMVVSNRL